MQVTTLLYFFARQSHQSYLILMTNSMWVTLLLYFFSRQSHQPCLIQCNLEQYVSGTALFPARQSHDSHQLCLIPQPIGCEWHCFISLSESLIWIMSDPITNRQWVTLLYFFARQPSHHYWSHDQQGVSDNHLFICQAVSSIVSHCPMTNSQWVILLCFFTRQSHKSYLGIPLPTDSEWHCFISLPGTSLINYVSFHDQQAVSGTALFLCQAVSSIMSHPMTNRQWVTLLYFWFTRQSHHVSFHN